MFTDPPTGIFDALRTRTPEWHIGKVKVHADIGVGFGWEENVAAEEFNEDWAFERVYQIGPLISVFSHSGYAMFVSPSINVGVGELGTMKQTTWVSDVNLQVQ